MGSFELLITPNCYFDVLSSLPFRSSFTHISCLYCMLPLASWFFLSHFQQIALWCSLGLFGEAIPCWGIINGSPFLQYSIQRSKKIYLWLQSYWQCIVNWFKIQKFTSGKILPNLILSRVPYFRFVGVGLTPLMASHNHFQAESYYTRVFFTEYFFLTIFKYFIIKIKSIEPFLKYVKFKLMKF